MVNANKFITEIIETGFAIYDMSQENEKKKILTFVYTYYIFGIHIFKFISFYSFIYVCVSFLKYHLIYRDCIYF
jgi:hypothetical protein